MDLFKEVIAENIKSQTRKTYKDTLDEHRYDAPKPFLCLNEKTNHFFRLLADLIPTQVAVPSTETITTIRR